MTLQPSPEKRKGFFRNNRRRLFRLPLILGLCILGLLAALSWGLDRSLPTPSASATATTDDAGTQQANATSTAVALFTEQDQYEYVERFDQKPKHWFVGTHDNEMVGIKDGVYIWVIPSSDGFTRYIDFDKGRNVRDFDVYIDLKVADSSAIDSVCSGFVFRKAPEGWEEGAYVFFLCNDHHYEVLYYEKQNWDTIQVSEHTDLIQTGDWNRIGIDAQGEHFAFTINNAMVFEMSDGRRTSGSLGIYVQVPKNESVILWVDNFGFQSR
jgi:hypothetical protein